MDMWLWLYVVAVVACALLVARLLLRHDHSLRCGRLIGEVMRMGVPAGVDQVILIRGLGIQRQSGEIVSLTAADCHAEVVGPAVPCEVPPWAPEGTQMAFDVTGRGTVFIDITTPLAPDLDALEFQIDAADPDVALVGNVVIMSPPAATE